MNREFKKLKELTIEEFMKIYKKYLIGLILFTSGAIILIIIIAITILK